MSHAGVLSLIRLPFPRATAPRKRRFRKVYEWIKHADDMTTGRDYKILKILTASMKHRTRLRSRALFALSCRGSLASQASEASQAMKSC